MNESTETKTVSLGRLVADPALATIAAEILKAIAHPVRLRIVALLCGSPRNVTSLAEQLEVPQAIVSQQLRILRMKDLVGVTRQGGFATYWIAEPHLREMLGCLSNCVTNEGSGAS